MSSAGAVRAVGPGGSVAHFLPEWRKAVAYEALTGLPYHCRRVRAWHPERNQGAIWRTLSFRVFMLGQDFEVAHGRTSKGKPWCVRRWRKHQ